MVKEKESIIIIIDTREQFPYEFNDSIVDTLQTGDYSVVGYRDKIAIERKSKQDAYGSLGGGRERFEKELIRLSKLNYAAIVIEASMTDFLMPPELSRMNPKSAMASLLSWSVKYGVCVFFACNRRMGSAVTFKLLEKYVKYFG